MILQDNNIIIHIHHNLMYFHMLLYERLFYNIQQDNSAHLYLSLFLHIDHVPHSLNIYSVPSYLLMLFHLYIILDIVSAHTVML